MALSAERVAVLLEALRGHSVAVEHITEEYKKNLNLAVRTEITVPVEGTDDSIKCYRFEAKHRTECCPVFVNIHGGGFVRKHELRDEIFSAKVADAIGGIVLDLDYKLAPEYPYPTAFNECYAACAYVFKHAAEWKADLNRISIGGHSAGGNLTAAICIRANETGDFKPCLQILDYAALDMVTDPSDKPDAEHNMIPAERGRMFTEAYTDGDLKLAKEVYCSPAFAADSQLKGLPEALIISAGTDNFRFEDHEYGKRLALCGVLVTEKCFINSRHGFIIHCSDNEWEEAQNLVINTIRRAGLA